MARELTFGDLHKDILKTALIDLELNDKILDVGCGYGAFLEKLYNNQFKNLYGIDGYMDPEFKEMTFIKSNLINKLPFNDNEFDRVFCTEVIEHVENQFALIKEEIRVLKSGGDLYITSPNIYSLVSKITFMLTGKLAYFLNRDVEFRNCPGHMTPFIINIITEYFKNDIVLKKTTYSDFVLPFTGGKVRLPFRNKIFGNIAIYEFTKIK